MTQLSEKLNEMAGEAVVQQIHPPEEWPEWLRRDWTLVLDLDTRNVRKEWSAGFAAGVSVGLREAIILLKEDEEG